MRVYVFSLIGEDDVPVMSTEVDEPNPTVDFEFWERFMQGDCVMEYRGSYEEKDD